MSNVRLIWGTGVVLSHLLLVEAIETAFEPMFVYNNKSGKDAEILRRYDEPAWNNPVVRFLDQAGQEIRDIIRDTDQRTCQKQEGYSLLGLWLRPCWWFC